MKTEVKVGRKLNKVMLIDDSRIDNFINQKVLQKADLANHIEVFISPEKALQHLEENLSEFPELILVDAIMPRISGFDFIEAVRKFPVQYREKCTIMVLSNLLPDITMKKMVVYPEVAMWIQKPLLLSNMNRITGFMNTIEMELV